MSLLSLLGVHISVISVLTALPTQESVVGQILGHVVKADDMAPLRSVTLLMQSSKEDFAAKTDVDGNFQVLVPAGHYKVLASRTGYVTAEYGQDDAWHEGRVVDVTAGEHVSLAMEMVPAAVIIGRVLDADGDPEVDNNVTAVVPALHAAALVAWPYSVDTDDEGHFRLFGLPPGMFYIRARAPSSSGAQTSACYYPGVTDLSLAMLVNAESGLTLVLGDIRCPAK
jgi:hypothetical protein